MGRVFSRAGNTVIYLGEASHEEAIAAAHGITALSNILDDLRVQAGIAQDDFGDDFYGLLVYELPTQISIDVSWNAIERLFNAAWFKRVWCVQEIVLACDTIRPSYAMYGHCRLQYRRTNQVGICLSFAKNLGNPFAVDLNIPDCVCGVGYLSSSSQEDSSLLAYLTSLRAHHASDPRDMVYGLLGTMRQHSDFDIASMVVVYGKSVAEVYTDVASAIIRQSQRLEILHEILYVKSSEYDPDFPSWVPRWDRRCGGRGLPWADMEEFQAQYPVSLSSQTGESTNFVVKGRKLLLYGTEHSKVANVSSLLDPDLNITISQCWPAVASIQVSFDQDLEGFSMVARTLSTGYTVVPDIYSDVSTEQRNQFLADFCDFLHHRRPHSSSKFAPYHSTCDLVYNSDTYTGSQNRYAHVFDIARKGRSLFQMADGRFGLGPDCLQEEDVIVAILGGFSPYALRPKGEEWCYLGPVYVDGLMDGTYFREQYDSGTPVQQFALI